MTAREYARVAGEIRKEQDALREKLSNTLDSSESARLMGKIDGLDLAMVILRNAVV